MVQSARPPANALVKAARKVYNPIGFSKGYNFILFFILGGAMIGFVLARFMLLDFDRYLCPPAGGGTTECHYFSKYRYKKVGILMHLAAILPAGMMVVMQFTPVIRHKFLIVHRITGYLILLLTLVSTAGVLMIGRHTFGGTLDTQVVVGAASIIFVGSQAIAYYNIKRLQIEQHRAWMLRAWVSVGFIITLRIISAIMAPIVGNRSAGYYAALPCYVVDNALGKDQTAVLDAYPSCAAFYSGASLEQTVAVAADVGGSPDQFGALLNSAFGASGWLALLIHIVGVEVYLHLTPAESERLRRVSYSRQLEAGMKNPGNAGLTAQKLGDAEPWIGPDDQSGSDSAKCDVQSFQRIEQTSV